MGFTNGITFNLDVSGIAGFFGGDESIAAMASVNLIRYRWLLGWYNSPGSYSVSKKYGTIARKRIWDGLFPGEDMTPAETLCLDGKQGPRFLGALSGTAIETTGHLSNLLFNYFKGLDAILDEASSCPHPSTVPSATQSEAQPLNSLTLVQLNQDSGSMPPIDKNSVVMDNFIHTAGIPGFIAALVTIGFSIGSAIIAAVVWHDYFCCIAIGIGIICNGLATLIYGSATLRIIIPPVTTVSPNSPGDGIFIRNNDVVILRGPSSKVAAIVRGKYELTYGGGPPYHRIGLASIALTFQAFSQIILLPAATLKGQIIFLATFALSWFYNAYLASVDRDQLQFKALCGVLGLDKNSFFKKTYFKKWASVVAASTFILHPLRPDSWVAKMIPNSTPVWDYWRECIVRAIDTQSRGETPTFDMPTEELEELTDNQKELLRTLLASAKIGYEWKPTKLSD